MLRRLFTVGTVLLALVAFVSTARAAQDKFTYAANGAPSAGFFVNNILPLGGGTTNTNGVFVALRLGGVFKSMDNGATWAYAGNGINGSAQIWNINRKAGSATELYAATLGDAGFYKTSNGGAQWFPKNSGLGCHVVRSIGFVGTDLILSTACQSNSGYYRSTDGGETWSRTWTSLPDDWKAFGFTRVSSTELYVNGSYGVYKSSNDGVSFSPANGTFPNTLPTDVSSQIFGFNRRASGTLVAHPEGNSIYYSNDGGANWFAASGLPAGGFSPTGMNVIGSNVYFSVDGAGLYLSSTGTSWAPLVPLGSLPASMIRNIFSDASNPNLWWAGTLGGVYQSSGAGNTGSNYTWTKTSTGLPGGVIAGTVHSTTPSTLVITSDTAYQSTDGGATWIPGSGIAATTAGNTLANVSTNSGAPGTFYVTTTYQGVFKSTNTGASWSAANSGITSKILPKFVAVAPSDANTVYATANCGATGNPGGVYKSSNSAGSWTNVTANLTNACAWSVAIHPTDPNTVYVVTGRALYNGTNGGLFQSSNGNVEGGLYKTTNGGLTWSFKNPGGVPFPVNGVNTLFSNPNVLLLRAYDSDNFDQAKTISGLYLSQDGGDSWTQILSNEKVRQARFVQTPGGRVDVYVATDGYFGDESNGDIAFRCVDLLNANGFSGENCTRLPLGATTRSLQRFILNGNQLVAATTTSGIAMQSYRFLGPDFNNDGAADVLWRQTDGRNFIWNLVPAAHADKQAVAVNPNTSMAVRTVPSPWIVAGMGDFNRDGHTDILWRNTSTGDNYLYLMDNGNIVFEGFLPNIPTAWTVAAVGDFNGDGYADIWWTNTSGGGLNYMYLMGVPSGTFPQVIGQGYMPTVGAPWTIAGTGDFNGDGKSDIWFRNTSTGDNYLYLLNGLTITSLGFTANVPTNWSIAGFGDFNGDGNTDVLWRENTLGYNYLYPMSGLSVLGTAGYLPTVSDTTWTVQGTGDTNKDGFSDLLWHQSTTGYNFVWRLDSTGLNVQSVCGSGIGCAGGVLPMIDEGGWSIVNK